MNSKMNIDDIIQPPYPTQSERMLDKRLCTDYNSICMKWYTRGFNNEEINTITNNINKNVLENDHIPYHLKMRILDGSFHNFQHYKNIGAYLKNYFRGDEK